MGKKRKKERTKQRNLLLGLALAAMALAVTGGCLLFLYQNNQKNNQTEGEPVKKVSQKQAEGEAESEPELTEEQLRELEIDQILQEMPLEDKVSQLFFIQPEALTGVGQAVQAGDMTREALQEYPVGGIILFADNIQSEEQLRQMLANLQEYSPYPLFLGVDEEGGPLVARVANSGVVEVPSFSNMRDIGNTGDPEQAYQVGTTIGGYLKDFGFNVDFAPVADVASNPDNQVIGPRSFGADAGLVSQMVAREVTGMQEQGVSAVLKHFPGHGDTGEDSHTEAALLDKTMEELESVELLPFQAGIGAGADMVMSGHISVPQVTGDNTPASMSPQILTGLLREKLGYEGIVITDSMVMGAIVNYYDPAQAAVQALIAGNDMILMPQDFQAARQAVIDAVGNQTLTEERIDESLRRIYRVKLKNIQ